MQTVSISLGELRPWRAAWLMAYYQAAWLLYLLAVLAAVEFVAAYKTSSIAFDGAGIVMLIYIFLFILGRYLSIRRLFKREASEVITYAFDDQNIYLQSETAKTEVTWKRARKFYTSKYFYLLRIDKAAFVILPKEKVSPELLALISTKLNIKQA